MEVRQRQLGGLLPDIALDEADARGALGAALGQEVEAPAAAGDGAGIELHSGDALGVGVGGELEDLVSGTRAMPEQQPWAPPSGARSAHEQRPSDARRMISHHHMAAQPSRHLVAHGCVHMASPPHASLMACCDLCTR